MKNILCSISTKGRYDTTLPLAISAVINQTKLPDHIVIFDDNENPEDLRGKEVYGNLFRMINLKGITWEVVYGEKKGQHYNHDKANHMGYAWVWRVDDDTIPEPNVLQELYCCTTRNKGVGCVGGSIITPSWAFKPEDKQKSSGKVSDIDTTMNKQWFTIDKEEEVEHLHCSFLYRAGICEYNLELSKIAHREETLFSYGFIKRGYQNYIVPCTTWHLKSSEGGIRDGVKELYGHDDYIFKKLIEYGFLVVMDNGIGDHIIFTTILSEVIERYKNVTVACCYPEIFEDYNITCISIAEAKELCNIDPYNIYKFMAVRGWKRPMVDAYREKYLPL
jgi:GT2 family glycosyltransferase